MRKVSHWSQNLGRMYAKCLRYEKFLGWVDEANPNLEKKIVKWDWDSEVWAKGVEDDVQNARERAEHPCYVRDWCSCIAYTYIDIVIC